MRAFCSECGQEIINPDLGSPRFQEFRGQLPVLCDECCGEVLRRVKK
jgi:hypothetical protein